MIINSIVSNRIKIKKHFDLKSKNYDLRSHSGLWKFIRLRELNKIKSILRLNYNLILEIGSGSGYYSIVLEKLTIKNLICLDLSKKMLDNISGSKIIKINKDILEFSSYEVFDLVFCAGAVEFCNVNDLLKKIKQLANQDSDIIFLLPLNNFFGYLYRFYYFTLGISINLFSYNKFQSVIIDNGFELVSWEKVLNFSVVCKIRKVN